MFISPDRRAGKAALWLAALGLGAGLCLLFPAILSTPSMRAHYPMEFFRRLIDAGLIGAAALGVISVIFAPRQWTGWAAIFCALSALVVGGGRSEAVTGGGAALVGLDFFV